MTKVRRKSQFSKWLITMIVLMNLSFTVSVLWLVWQDKPEPVALIGAWFAFTTGELWLLATIKKTKVRRGVPNANQLEAEAVQPEVLDADSHADQ